MAIAKWKQYSKEQIEDIVRESISYAEVIKKLGYSKSGSIHEILKTYLEENNIDTSHFLSQAHNKNKFDYERFQNGNAIKTKHMHDALEALRGHKCESCGLEIWLDQPIPLEIHHKDGNHLNSDLSNLVLLCPNCHACTDNWRGKNISKIEKEPISEEQFVEALKSKNSIRQALISLGLTGAGGNYERAYELIVKYNIEHLKK